MNRVGYHNFTQRLSWFELSQDLSHIYQICESNRLMKKKERFF
jgi:hypothetical protein